MGRNGPIFKSQNSPMPPKEAEFGLSGRLRVKNLTPKNLQRRQITLRPQLSADPENYVLNAAIGLNNLRSNQEQD